MCLKKNSKIRFR